MSPPKTNPLPREKPKVSVTTKRFGLISNPKGPDGPMQITDRDAERNPLVPDSDLAVAWVIPAYAKRLCQLMNMGDSNLLKLRPAQKQPRTKPKGVST